MDNKQIIKEIISITLTILIACTVFVVCDVFFKLATWNTYNTPSYSLKFSMLLSIIVYTLFLAFTKKTWKATLISYILIFIISIINQLKVIFSGEPLYFSDINFLSQSGDLIGLVVGNVSLKFVLQFIGVIAIYGGILSLLTFASYKTNFELKNKKIRIPLIILDIVILLCLFIPNKYTKELYLKVFFNTDEYVDFDSYTTNLGFYNRNGLINGMYGILLNNIFVEPENYDENTLNNMLDSAKVETEKYGKPNIIVVFSESFWDIDQLEEIEFDKAITSNYNSLKEKGKLVNVITPSYGGMSENVTFEVMTGGSMNYFSKGYIPIMSLYSRKNSENIPSIVKNLKSNGYITEINFGKDYYNSQKAYSKLGFDTYREFIEGKSEHLSDKYCTDILIKRLEQKSNTPLLYVMATIEGHMPYSKDKYDNYDISITKSNLSESMNDTVLSYAQGIYNSDYQLGRLYEFIENFDEPTILIFLGDHLPFMYTEDGKNVIFELDYFNTDDELLNNYRLYNSQALILSNYEEEIELPEYIGTDLLLNYVVNQLEVEVEPYYKWLYNTTEVLPGINKYISFDKEGNLYAPTELTKEMNEVYENRKLMQYKLFINN